MKSKRGAYFFIVDVLIGVLVFFVTIAIISSFHVSAPSLGGVEQTLGLLTNDLYTIALANISDNPAIIELNLTVFDKGMSIDDLVLQLVKSGNKSQAVLVITNATAWLPQQFGFEYSLDNVSIYKKSSLLISKNDSSVMLSQKKISLFTPSLNSPFSSGVTEVTLWQ